MSINITRLYDAKAIKFGVSTTSATFNTVFMECLYKTAIDIVNFTGMTIVPPDESSTDISIDEKFYQVISAGLDFFIQDTNMFTANPIPDAEQRYVRAKKESQRLYQQSIDMTPKLGTLTSYTINSLQREGYAL
jgi:hypothetical protein